MGLFSKPEIIGPGGASDADRARVAELERRVATLEAQVASLLAAPPTRGAMPPGVLAAGVPTAGAPAVAGTPVEPAWLQEVRELRRTGKTIHAIKLYRENTGVGLKQAKDAVEAMPG